MEILRSGDQIILVQHHLNYNDESSGSLIALMFPGLIHKFYKLEKHPNK